MAGQSESVGSTHEDLPDLMNDPRYTTNNDAGDDRNSDPDTCRICRGESGDAEPLFHPCKCSGSIKYVHQDCLMEWLSHSQKKHCELCKTAFRFTKLYSPNMPQSLPFHVLVQHLLLHAVKNLATWLRFCMVMAVWLGFLPYTIRQVWKVLFWFSDGGWPLNNVAIDTSLTLNTTSALKIAQELLLAKFTGNGTSPATPFHATPTNPASIGVVVDGLIGFLMSASQNLNTDTLTAGLSTSIYYGFDTQSVVLPVRPLNSTSASQNSMNPYPTSRNPSLLSEISLLRNLTRNSYFNQLVITIVEGYIITLLVVACFILVFLIREWVVQQQPGINMGAGFNADFAAPERFRDDGQMLEPPGDLRAGQNNIQENERRERGGPHPIPRVRRRDNDVEVPDHDVSNGEDDRLKPIRDASAPAAEIQRGIAEVPRMAEEFLNIWRRAGGDPEEVLRIIEREDRSDELRYWVNAMKILQNTPEPGRHPLRTPTSELVSPENGEEGYSGSSTTRFEEQVGFVGAPAYTKRNTVSVFSTDFPQALSLQGSVLSPDHTFSSSNTYEQALDKGKARARTVDETLPTSYEAFVESNFSAAKDQRDSESTLLPLTPWEAPSLSASSSRLRSVSDGPILNQQSFLANNNWSFSNLPDGSEQDLAASRDNLESSNNEIAPPQNTASNKTVSFKGRDNYAWKDKQDTHDQQNNAKWRQLYRQAQEHQPITPTPVLGMKSLNHDTVSSERLTSTYVEDGQDSDQDVRGRSSISSLSFSERPDRNGEGNSSTWSEAVLMADSSSDPDEDSLVDTNDPPNSSESDIPLPGIRNQIAVQAEAPNFFGTIAEFFWGGVGDNRRHEDQGVNEERIVHDLAEEAPFVPVARDDFFDQGEVGQANREFAQAAIAAGLDPNDPDGIEDAEDFEGIMELVGMRGPLFSLVQNALFSAFLLALTVAFGVWIPYNIGRVSLLLIANPGPAFKVPLRLVFGCAAFMQDLGLSILGVMSWCLIRLLATPYIIYTTYVASGLPSIASQVLGLTSTAIDISFAACQRIRNGVVDNMIHITDSEIFAFSAASHESLITIQNLIIDFFRALGAIIVYIFGGDYSINLLNTPAIFHLPFDIGWQNVIALPGWLLRPESWVISLDVGKRTIPLDLRLSVWDSMDRFWATLTGYAALCVLGVLYVRKGSPFSTGQIGREWEAAIIDILNQAGGVMKVILIISIEMLVFPLYCGLLLDAALLPLFENATISSRILFTMKSPLTSVFVHWFVGTCYMFHFALFVSMCRKIMRKGVLYFIRDPDDPTFHPVRDVLERNVATQLRKILFSALVYGGLVVICLGGVVWGISFTFKGVLPIHWSSNEPVLEFPIDLLFYNFLMPLAVQFLKPSDSLHAMYSWWFHRCARMLRLTWFMFDERKPDEEGFLVRKTWGDLLRGAQGDPFSMVTHDDSKMVFENKPHIRAYYRRNGRYVRAPASDQVRIPKGSTIFLEVDENNNRIDGEPDRNEGIHGKGSSSCKQVYIPPWFRLRIFLFIIFIWLFAAITGVSITLVPLVFGRAVFAKIIPPHVRKNDIYAFSIGIYILGSAMYCLLHLKRLFICLCNALAVNADTPQKALRRVASASIRMARILWIYSAFLLILPTLFAFLVEFYFIVPLHTYFSIEERHVVHFVQSWTLGLLYVKLTTRLILWHEDSRPAQSLRAITRDGYMNPDARLATRCFIFPAALLLSTALFCPWALARLTVLTILKNSPEKHLLAYRYSYPICLCACLIGLTMWVIMGWVSDWRMKIRDDVYLIGERLHNFGERKLPSGASPSHALRRFET